jgi:hypothetical protein
MAMNELKLFKLLLLVANAVFCVISFIMAITNANAFVILLMVTTYANTAVIATSKHYL